MTLAAWAQATERIRIGLMVGANPFRSPALTAKMATALDHISDGRAYLGIGSAWNDDEARDFGIEFGESPAERLRWLREALPVMRDMLHGKPATAGGPRYTVQDARNDPRARAVAHAASSSAAAARRSRCGWWHATPTRTTSASRRAWRDSSARKRRCAGIARRSAVTSARSSGP